MAPPEWPLRGSREGWPYGVPKETPKGAILGYPRKGPDRGEGPKGPFWGTRCTLQMFALWGILITPRVEGVAQRGTLWDPFWDPI